MKNASSTHGEPCLVTQGSKIFVDGGRGDPVPTVSEEQGQAHRPGEEEVHPQVAAGSAACGVTEADCQGAGVFRAADGIVAGATGRAKDYRGCSTGRCWSRRHSSTSLAMVMTIWIAIAMSQPLPEVVLGDIRHDRRRVGHVGGPEGAALHDGDVGIGDHP